MCENSWIWTNLTIETFFGHLGDEDAKMKIQPNL